MNRLFYLASFAFILVCTGCSKPATSNVAESADQAAIDAYNAQVAADEAAMESYEEPK